ncbi:MAG: Uma2 family endonuclease [Planctomycetaceae bacterium]|nr:Uma2 family endonuclease [Planctomycetaceae bacterium]
MVERGAFECIGPKKVELLHGALRFTHPAGPLHDDLIEHLTCWSVNATHDGVANVRVQCGFVCADNRLEPDILWLKPRRNGCEKPKAEDVLLLIEVADSSLATDLLEKATIYAEDGVAEYWGVDVRSARIHVMSECHAGTYRQIQRIVSPNLLSPRCRRSAGLDTADLFSVV